MGGGCERRSCSLRRIVDGPDRVEHARTRTIRSTRRAGSVGKCKNGTTLSPAGKEAEAKVCGPWPDSLGLEG